MKPKKALPKTKEMSGKDFRRIQKEKSRELSLEYEQAKRYFNRKRGNLFDRYESEDFASWVIEKKLMGRKASFRQLFIDYLRLNVIDKRYNKDINPRDTKKLSQSDVYHNPVNKLHRKMDYSILMRHLTPTEVKILTMFYFYNYTLIKISQELGLAEYNMGERLKGILNKLKKYIKRRDLWNLLLH